MLKNKKVAFAFYCFEAINQRNELGASPDLKGAKLPHHHNTPNNTTTTPPQQNQR